MVKLFEARSIGAPLHCDTAVADLPSSGVTYYDVPKEYGVTKYRDTVVNDRTVLVDPGTHKVIQVIE